MTIDNRKRLFYVCTEEIGNFITKYNIFTYDSQLKAFIILNDEFQMELRNNF